MNKCRRQIQRAISVLKTIKQDKKWSSKGWGADDMLLWLQCSGKLPQGGKDRLRSELWREGGSFWRRGQQAQRLKASINLFLFKEQEAQMTASQSSGTCEWYEFRERQGQFMLLCRPCNRSIFYSLCYWKPFVYFWAVSGGTWFKFVDDTLAA